MHTLLAKDLLESLSGFDAVFFCRGARNMLVSFFFSRGRGCCRNAALSNLDDLIAKGFSLCFSVENPFQELTPTQLALMYFGKMCATI